MWVQWSTTNDIPFKSDKKSVGDGEEKLCAELGLPLSCVGGQNSTGDIIVPRGKNISVKKYSESAGGFCRLGAECQEELSKILHAIHILYTWCEKYSENYVAQKIQKRIPNLGSIVSRGEISTSKVKELNELTDQLASIYGNSLSLGAQCRAFKSDLLSASILMKIVESGKSLQDLLNDVARREAIEKRLYLVHDTLGYTEINDPEMIWCPRITQSKPRIAIKDPYLCF